MCMSEAAANATSLQPAGGSGFQILSYVQGAETTIASTLNALLVSLENLAITLGREAVIFLVIVGVLLYYSRLGPHLGKKLLEGGIVIGVFLLFVAPYLTVAVANC